MKLACLTVLISAVHGGNIAEELTAAGKSRIFWTVA
jgi:hypothetical protein